MILPFGTERLDHINRIHSLVSDINENRTVVDDLHFEWRLMDGEVVIASGAYHTEIEVHENLGE